LDVWTDGRVSPDEAIKTSAALLCQHLNVFLAEDDSIEFETPSKSDTSEQEELRRKLNMSVNEIELSVRSANCLNSANIKTVGELVMKDEAAMLKYRNFGKKSLTEIKEKLQEMGLYLGFKFDPNLLDKIND
jgi:DNA-directed RNA polymerase subunit alpha